MGSSLTEAKYGPSAVKTGTFAYYALSEGYDWPVRIDISREDAIADVKRMFSSGWIDNRTRGLAVFVKLMLITDPGQDLSKLNNSTGTVPSYDSSYDAYGTHVDAGVTIFFEFSISGVVIPWYVQTMPSASRRELAPLFKFLTDLSLAKSVVSLNKLKPPSPPTRT